MHKLIILFLLLVLQTPLLAQSSMDLPRHSLAAGASYDFGNISDEFYSPLIYNKSGFSVDLLYHSSPKPLKFYTELSFHFAMGSMKYKDYAHFTSMYYDARIDLDCMWRLFPRSQVVGLYLGFRTQAGGNGLYLDTDASAYSYLINYSLMPMARLTITAKKLTLSTQFTMPLISYVTRPPRNGYTEVATETVFQAVINALVVGDFAGPTKYQSMTWKSGVIYQFNENFAMGLNYTFMLEKYKAEKSFADLSNIFNISFAFTI